MFSRTISPDDDTKTTRFSAKTREYTLRQGLGGVGKTLDKEEFDKLGLDANEWRTAREALGYEMTAGRDRANIHKLSTCNSVYVGDYRVRNEPCGHVGMNTAKDFKIFKRRPASPAVAHQLEGGAAPAVFARNPMASVVGIVSKLTPKQHEELMDIMHLG